MISKLSIIIPTYNKALTIIHLISDKILTVNLVGVIYYRRTYAEGKKWVERCCASHLLYFKVAKI